MLSGDLLNIRRSPHYRKSESRLLKAGRTLLYTPGSDYESPLELLYLHKDMMVILWRGFTGWASLGTTLYNPSTYFLVQIEKIADNQFKVLKVLREEQPGKKWRAIKSLLVEEANSLGKES